MTPAVGALALAASVWLARGPDMTNPSRSMRVQMLGFRGGGARAALHPVKRSATDPDRVGLHHDSPARMVTFLQRLRVS